MAIQVPCPGGHVINVKDKYAGKMGRCPRCGTTLEVPDRQLTDDDVLGLLESDDEDDRPVHQDPFHDEDQESSGISLIDPSSAIHVGPIRECPRCKRKVHVPSNNVCPNCGVYLTYW